MNNIRFWLLILLFILSKIKYSSVKLFIHLIYVAILYITKISSSYRFIKFNNYYYSYDKFYIKSFICTKILLILIKAIIIIIWLKF